MARDVIQMLGLETDLPPDQAGNQALRLLNVVPGSNISVKPRSGIEQIAQYEPLLDGRAIIVDTLPGDPTNGLLVICQNNLNVYGTVLHSNDALFEWRPNGQSSDFSEVVGTAPGTRIYGVFDGEFKVFDFIIGTYETLDPASASGFVPLFPIFLRPSTYDESGYGSGLYKFPSGLMLITGTKGLPVPSVRVHAYDVATGEESQDVHLADSVSGASTAFNVGSCNLGFPYSGFVMWWNSSADDTPRVRVVLNSKYNLPGQNLNGMGTVGFTLNNSDVLTGPQIADITPLSRARQPSLLVSKRSTEDAYQLLLIRQTIDLPVDGVSDITYVTVAAANFTAADWAGWIDRPDTCLAAQQIVINSRVNTGRMVALLGNWVLDPVLHVAIDNPRIALLNGNAQTGTGVVTNNVGSNALNVINSHANGVVTGVNPFGATGTTSTGTPTGSTVVWSFTGTGVGSATLGAGAKSTYAKITNFGFDLDPAAVITSVTFSVARKASVAASITDNDVRIVVGGTPVGSDLSQANIWSVESDIMTYTHSIVGLTGADVNASDFGIAISAVNNGGGSAIATIWSVSLQVSYDNNTFRAHGMVANQLGYVYACGTGDFVVNEATYLLLKYDPHDFTIPVARVAHGSNGLGDYYTDPLNTHICNLMVDGSYVLVLDVDPDKTRLFVYNLDLTYIGKWTLSATSVMCNKFSTKFFAQNY